MTVYTLITLICIDGVCGLATPEAPIPLYENYKTCLSNAVTMQKQIESVMTGSNADVVLTSCVSFSETITH